MERREARLEQVQGEAVGDIVDFGIRDARVAIDEGDAFGVALEYRREFFGERPVPPVALFAVAPREFGRKRDDSFQQAALLVVSSNLLRCTKSIPDPLRLAGFIDELAILPGFR